MKSYKKLENHYKNMKQELPGLDYEKSRDVFPWAGEKQRAPRQKQGQQSPTRWKALKVNSIPTLKP